MIGPLNGVKVPCEERWGTGFSVIKNNKQHHTCISVLSLDVVFQSEYSDMNALFFCPTEAVYIPKLWISALLYRC